MAINKRKILSSAQKHLQKGSLDRALKDYRTLLEADPRDTNVRLKVGDIYLKQGKTSDASGAYLKVAQQFMNDGFDAKAVALFKQITKMDPKRLDVYVPLADLYQRLGLIRDAMAALQTAADGHYREGNKPAALDVVRKMATLDPSNTTNRLKVAELLRQEGMAEEALAEYRECAAELERQGETDGRIGVLEKVLELAADDRETLIQMGRAQIERQRFSQAEEVARKLIDAHPTAAVEGCEILADAYRGLRREDALPDVYRKMADALRERGNEDEAREILQTHVPSDGFSLDPEDAEDSDESESEGLVLGEAPELELDEEETSLELELDHSSDPDDDSLPAPSGAAATQVVGASGAAATQLIDAAEPGETGGDAEQLIAEASVFQRYGKQDRALEALRQAAAAAPEDPALRERLAAGFSACGETASAEQWFARAAEAFERSGQSDAAGAIRARMAGGGVAPGAAIEPQAAADPSAMSDPDISGDDFDFGEDVFGSSDPDQAPLAGTPADPSVATEVADPDAIEIETPAEAAGAIGDGPGAGAIEFDFDENGDSGIELTSAAEAAAEAAAAAEPAVLPDEPGPEVELAPDAEAPQAPAAAPAADGDGDVVEALADSLSDPNLEVSFDVDEEIAVDTETPAAPEAAEAVAPAPDEIEIEIEGEAAPAAGGNVQEQLDEAAFYLQQGLGDEAEAVVLRVLEAHPDHAGARARLAEIEASRPARAETRSENAEAEDDVLVLGDDATSEPESETPAVEPEIAIDVAAEAEAELEPAAAPEPLAADAEALGAESIEEPIFDLAETTAPLEELAPEPAGASEPQAEAQAASEERDTAGDFDLAEELSGAFHGDADDDDGTEGEGFEEVFAAFKKGVEQQLGEDVDARFDLGIAYKEMGLLEDAMGEFRAALAGASRKLDCLHMMGLCAIELGQAGEAVGHLEQALALPEVPAEQQTPLRFELGCAYQAEGDLERAASAFEAVVAEDPAFRDAAERLEQARSGEVPQDDSPFESFDDLMDADEAEPEEADASAGAEPEDAAEDAVASEPDYESFEDIAAEATDEDDGEFLDAEVVEAPEDGVLTPAAEVEDAARAAEADDAARAAEAENAAPAAVDEAAPASDDANEGAASEGSDEPRKKRRRRKISFV